MSKLKDKADELRDKVADKLPDKLRKKDAPLTITNDTIAEHREKILAGGRKFKYPLQYSKHKILINVCVIVLVALVAFGVWLWAMLYRTQATGDFYYNATRVLPLPVANVDGQNVPYSDYLRRIRADIYYYENQESKSFNTADGRRELNYNKRKELDAAEKTAYAYKLARLRKISVSDAETDAKITAQRQADGSDEAAVTRMLKSYYNWTMSEYKQTVHDQLLEQKVAFAVDQTAKNKVDEVEKRLRNGEGFAAVAKDMSDDPLTKNSGGEMIAKTADADPNGIIAAARRLQPGQVSGAIAGVGRDATLNDRYAYFIVKLISKTDDETEYAVIAIGLNEFDNEFASLKDKGKISEYIKVPAADAAD